MHQSYRLSGKKATPAKPLEFYCDLGYNLLSNTYRGVAQLVARAVWDREVEGSSPFTPTI